MTALNRNGVLPTLEAEDDAGKVVAVNSAGTNYQLIEASAGGGGLDVVKFRLSTPGTPTFSPATILPLLVANTEGTLFGGPVTLAPGGVVGLEYAYPALTPGATLTMDDYVSELCVTNLAGTQKLSVSNVPVDLTSSTSGPIPVTIDNLNEQIGSDLTVVDGQIVSTAGGAFLMWANIQVDYEAAP